MPDPVPPVPPGPSGPSRRATTLLRRRSVTRFGFEDQIPIPPPAPESTDTLPEPAADVSTDLPAGESSEIADGDVHQPIASDATTSRIEMELTPIPPVPTAPVTGYNRTVSDSQDLTKSDSGFVQPGAASVIVANADHPPAPPASQKVGPPTARVQRPEASQSSDSNRTNSHDMRLILPHLKGQPNDLSHRLPPPAPEDVHNLPARDPVKHLSPATAPGVTPGSQSGNEMLGELFGEFLLLRRFNAGGFGEVWTARDTSTGKNVVLKRLQTTHLENKSAFYQFDIEIEIGRRVKHPNLVPILKSGVIDGRRYFSMPEIAGPSLTQVLRSKSEQKLSFNEILGALEAIGRALGHIHRAGVIHCDLKPDNILFESRTRPMLIDLGVARTVNWEVTGYRALKGFQEERRVMGTPEYMAPELVRGDPLEIGSPVDLYSMGVILYELLCGQPPFHRDPALAHDPQKAIIQLMVNVQREVPLPVKLHNPAAPASLAALAMQCLAKKTSERPASADEFAAALARHLRPLARPGSATPSGRPDAATATKAGPLARLTRILRNTDTPNK